MRFSLIVGFGFLRFEKTLLLCIFQNLRQFVYEALVCVTAALFRAVRSAAWQILRPVLTCIFSFWEINIWCRDSGAILPTPLACLSENYVRGLIPIPPSTRFRQPCAYRRRHLPRRRGPPLWDSSSRRARTSSSSRVSGAG